MILTVTLNPMLDKTVELETLRRGAIHRSRRVSSVVGGKGVNVARQLTLLGSEALATGLLGGEIGSMLERMLTEEGIPHEFFRIAGMTREGVTFREGDGSWTAVFEPPHAVEPGEAEECLAHISRLMADASWVVCSGSSPSPGSDFLYEAIIREARRRGKRTWLDSYGEVFRRGLGAIPGVVQANRLEVEESLSLCAGTEEEVRRVFSVLRERGVERAILTHGAGMAYAADGLRVWAAVPPAVEGVNPTGSGDSLAAGTLAWLDRGEPFEEAFRFGVAAGAANAARWSVADSRPEEIAELLPLVRIQELIPLTH
jgi:1-phosphofructokinase family hexose kinase